MTEKDEWNVCLKKLPHQYAVLIKTLVKASPLQDVSVKKQELLKQANAIIRELNVNTEKHKTFKISDFQKVNPPYTPDQHDEDKYRRYQPTTRPKPVKKASKVTKKKTTKVKSSKDAHGYQKKPRKVRKDKGIKRGPQKNPKKK